MGAVRKRIARTEATTGSDTLKDMKEALDTRRNRGDEFDADTAAALCQCLKVNKGCKIHIRQGTYPSGHQFEGCPATYIQVVTDENVVVETFNVSCPFPPWSIS